MMKDEIIEEAKEGQLNRKKRYHKKRKQKLYVKIGILCALLLLIIAATIAWFYSRRSVATVTVMGTPSDLAIVGADNGELRLDMTPGDPDAQKGADGTMTIQRVFGVKSKSKEHWLEIAHTTNIKNFSFHIYPVIEITSNDNGSSSYTRDTSSINGSYKNENTALTSEDDTGKTADTSAPFYENNYNTNDKVQQNAIPLYWMSDKLATTSASTSNTDGSTTTYYYLEVSWKETEKETDVFYIFASDSVTQ